jgi:DNA polymerase-3 subunit delta'
MLNNVVGHQNIKDMFLKKITGDPSGTYLFFGPPSIGKRTMAFEIAKVILCENRKDECLCQSCKIFSKGHPDFLCVGRTERIKVEDIDRILDFAYISPFLSNYKVVVLDNAHNITWEASNRLLKVLEEPPQGLSFFLVTAEPQALLKTILSRCIQYEFQMLPREDMTNILWKKMSFELSQARILGWLASDASADIFSKAGHYLKYRDMAFAFMSEFKRKRLIDSLDFVDKVERDDLTIFIDMIVLLLTDMLLLKYDVKDIANADLGEKLRKVNDGVSYKALVWAVSNISQVKRYEHLNINLNLALKNSLIKVYPIFISC